MFKDGFEKVANKEEKKHFHHDSTSTTGTILGGAAGHAVAKKFGWTAKNIKLKAPSGRMVNSRNLAGNLAGLGLTIAGARKGRKLLADRNISKGDKE